MLTLGIPTLAFGTLLLALYVLPTNQIEDYCTPTQSVGINYRIWGMAAAAALASTGTLVALCWRPRGLTRRRRVTVITASAFLSVLSAFLLLVWWLVPSHPGC